MRGKIMAGDARAPEPVGEAKDGRWTKTTWIPEIDAAHQIRVERLQRELAIDKTAAADGRNNEPGGGETTLNALQLEICNRVFAGILLLNQFLSQQLGKAVKQARQLVSTKLDVTHTNGLITDAIENGFNERRQELVRLRFHDLSRHRDLRYFRRMNGLNRSAHYKESVALVLGVLFIAFAAESLMNGALLSAVMADGLVGGASLAALISLINIISGIMAGVWGWRLIGHCKIALKVLGVVITLVLHSAALAWNFFIANFREVAEIAAARPDFDFNMAAIGAETLEHMQVYGLSGMGSVQAWALLLLGVFIHFLAAKEGWDDFADRYVDYKKFDKRARDARAAFDDALADLRAHTRQIVEQIEAQVEDDAGRARRNLDALSGLVDLAQQRRQEIKDSEDEWVAGGTQLLKLYREANEDVRDERKPAYFDTFPSAQDYRRRDFGAGLEQSDEIEHRTHLVNEAMAELGALKNKAAEAAEKAEEALAAVRRHSTLAIRKLDKRLEQEDRNITEEAEKRLAGETGDLEPANDARMGNAAA
jgi:hypothetical protein